MKGISVLISAQNDEHTIRLCAESFLDFGDEVIIVTNGSTDNTVNLCKELASEYPNKIQYFDQPEIAHLHENRQFAFERSKYNWIFRCDADYVAYNDDDGQYSVSNLRKILLSSSPFRPTAHYFTKVNLEQDFYHTSKEDIKLPPGKYVPLTAPVNKVSQHRIYSKNPLLVFRRNGRWEGVPYVKYLYKKVYHKDPFWFHLTFKTPEDRFRRSERTNWRELGDFETYPTLSKYIEKKALPKSYAGMSYDEAVSFFFKEYVEPNLVKYDENTWYPYPARIKREMAKETTA